MILLIKQACKFLVSLSVLLGVFTEAYAGIAPTVFNAPNGTVGSAYSFNLQTMPVNTVGTANFNGGGVFAFGDGTTFAGADPCLACGLTFNGTSLITGTPNALGNFNSIYTVNGGPPGGQVIDQRYSVFFSIFAAAVAASGGGGGDSAPACNCITFTGGSSTINGGTVTIGGSVYSGTLTVGPLGATMVYTGPGLFTFFYANLVLNGPLTIVRSSGGDVVYFNGRMTGSGSLTIGTGARGQYTEAYFTGNSTRTEPTFVTEGSRISAAGRGESTPLGSGNILVAGRANLSGAYPGNVSVLGDGSAFRTGGSPGYASYGSLAMGAGSTYLQDIAGKVQSDVSTITGTAGTYSFANITGGLFIESGTTLTPLLSNLFSASEPGYGSSIYIPVLGDRFRIFTAAGGITGRFTTLTQPAELSSGTQLIALYNVNNGNSVDLAIAPTSYSSTLSSSTTNAKAVAGVLD